MFMAITILLSCGKGVKYCCVWSQLSLDMFQTCCSKSCLVLICMNLLSLLKVMGYNCISITSITPPPLSLSQSTLSITSYLATVKCARCPTKITHSIHSVQCIPLLNWHQTFLWAVTSLIFNVSQGLFVHTNMAQCESDHSVPSSAQVKNDWYYTFNPPYMSPRHAQGQLHIFEP